MRKDVKIGVVVGVALLLLIGWYFWPTAPQPTEQPPTFTEPAKQTISAEKKPRQSSQVPAEAEPLAQSAQPTLTVPEPKEAKTAEHPSSPTLLTATGAAAESPVGPGMSASAQLGGANRAVEAPIVQPEPAEPTVPEMPEPTPVVPPPVESVPEPAGPAAIGREPLVHVVLRGESIAKIAERYYGSQAYAGLLLKANPHVADPRRMPVGTKLTVPALPVGVRLASAEPSGKPVRTAKLKEQPATVTYREYRVRRGDTFYSIAARMLDNSQRWRELLEANFDLVDGKPENLKAGQIIRVPIK